MAPIWRISSCSRMRTHRMRTCAAATQSRVCMCRSTSSHPTLTSSLHARTHAARTRALRQPPPTLPHPLVQATKQTPNKNDDHDDSNSSSNNNNNNNNKRYKGRSRRGGGDGHTFRRGCGSFRCTRSFAATACVGPAGRKNERMNECTTQVSEPRELMSEG